MFDELFYKEGDRYGKILIQGQTFCFLCYKQFSNPLPLLSVFIHRHEHDTLDTNYALRNNFQVNWFLKEQCATLCDFLILKNFKKCIISSMITSL